MFDSLRRRLATRYLKFEKRIRPLRLIRRRFTRYNADVFFVSFPKSGRTWVRFVLGRAIQLQYGIAPDRKLVLDRALYSRIHPDVVLKVTHDLGAREDAGYSGQDKRGYRGKQVFLLSRDIRDTLVSYYHHRTDRKDEVDMTLSEYIRSERYGARKIALFYRAWQHAADLPAQFLHIRYEELRRGDTFAIMRQIADFLGLHDIGADVLRQACSEGEFSNMKRLEQQNEISILQKSGDASEMQDDAKRVRKGRVGGFRDEMTADDIAYIERVVAEVGVSPEWVFDQIEVAP